MKTEPGRAAQRAAEPSVDIGLFFLSLMPRGIASDGWVALEGWESKGRDGVTCMDRSPSNGDFGSGIWLLCG